MKSTSHPKVHVAVYDDIPLADRAVAALIEAGIPKDRISVICPTCTHDKFQEVDKQEPSGSHTPGRVAAGGAIGAALGGLAAAVSLAATGGLSVLVAGPLLFASGTGAVFGGFVGAMTTRGMEHEVADFYDQALQRGKVLVAVEASEDVDSEHLAIADRILDATASERVNLKKT